MEIYLNEITKLLNKTKSNEKKLPVERKTLVKLAANELGKNIDINLLNTSVVLMLKPVN